jgi:hypothetical protein
MTSGRRDACRPQHAPHLLQQVCSPHRPITPRCGLPRAVAARYSGKQYSTLDNTDVVSHVYGACDRYFVVDAKVHYEATANFMFDFGIDNVLNEQYSCFVHFPAEHT